VILEHSLHKNVFFALRAFFLELNVCSFLKYVFSPKKTAPPPSLPERQLFIGFLYWSSLSYVAARAAPPTPHVPGVAPVGAPGVAAAGLYGEWRGYS
jgi:hypothetical protein